MFVVPRPDRVYTAEWEIKRSRFIGIAGRVDTEEQARSFINRVRQQYPDARHHCSAYRYLVDGAQPVERSSDDGEPSGTAGAPMLDVVRGSGLDNLACVVVRYFGGIKLGAGGLVHAYSHSAQLALENIDTMRREKLTLVAVELPPGDAGRIEAHLRAKGITVYEVDYGPRVTLTLAVGPDQVDAAQAQLAELSSGSARPRAAGQTWVETPAHLQGYNSSA